jgi:hypothetical protein
MRLPGAQLQKLVRGIGDVGKADAAFRGGMAWVDGEIRQPPQGEDIDHDDGNQDALDHLPTILTCPPASRLGCLAEFR